MLIFHQIASPADTKSYALISVSTCPICDSPLRDRRGTTLLRYRNRSEITVLMCKQKPYPVWFWCRRKSHSLQCEHSLSQVVICTVFWHNLSNIKRGTFFVFALIQEKFLLIAKCCPRSYFQAYSRLILQKKFYQNTDFLRLNVNFSRKYLIQHVFKVFSKFQQKLTLTILTLTYS